MPQLKEAPLVEVIFELRWGETNVEENATQFTFKQEEITLLAGEFKSATKETFPHYEKVNEGVMTPFIVNHQFWTAKNKWPCLQLGLGILTVNLTNDDYSWELFKETCINALKLLEMCHPNDLDNLPAIGVELRYQDGFKLSDDETDGDFLSKKAQIDFDIPKEFLESPLVDSNVHNHHIEFSLRAITPEGILINKLDRGFIGGQPAFIQNTRVRSFELSCPEISISGLSEWLEQAHQIQQHAFKTLILPTHSKA